MHHRSCSVVAFFCLGLLLVATSSSFANQLVSNGDFELGDTGFGSDYVSGANIAGGYLVATNPQSLNGLFGSFGDHTSGAGQFFISNGSTDPTDRVWFQDLQVFGGQPVEVEFFAASVFPDNPAEFAVEADGVSLGTLDLDGLAVGEFARFAGSFTPAASGATTLSIRSLTTAASGNDFALDDISAIQTIPEPSAIGLATASLGIAFRRRRRRA